jgi:protein-S-isoprenylcysteine O-methyltransferase Ste14
MSLNVVFGLIIIVCWLVFIVYWLISARRAKADARRNYVNWGVRLFLVAAIVIARLRFGRVARFHVWHFPHPVFGAVGVVLCVLGTALALWARVHLGRNWGMPMTVKKDPELVTTGPYAHVRHPIYAGVLLMMLGSAGAISFLWLALAAVLGAYFTYSALQEQKIMLKEFPDTYPAYMKRTKMLIPFVF